ncbi:MAG TPA: cupredoxin domain-containing protein [Candidatus Binatia bacterium]|nr:cupredoxin domain-containing protein [Candidatus Binatia bacterium]
MADSVAWRSSFPGFWLAIVVVVATVTGCTGDDSAGAVGRDAQRIEIEVAASGYRPSRVEAKAGRPLVLVFRRTAEDSCGAKVVIPSLDIERDLPLGEAVEISLPEQSVGTVDFACAMDMMHGSLVVR